MKVRITHLKSTGWPKDAKVGDVVSLEGDAIPAWALGKCMPVEDEPPAAEGGKKPAAEGGKK